MSKALKSNLDKVKKMKDKDIVYDEDCPETDEKFWTTGIITINIPKNKKILEKNEQSNSYPVPPNLLCFLFQ